MWQGSYAFPKAAPRAHSPWAVIKIRCLLRHFKDKAGERRAMWFTTLLDKSHDAARPFAKYPDLFMTADRSAVLGEKKRKEVFGALPLFQKNYDFVKMLSQEHLCHKSLILVLGFITHSPDTSIPTPSFWSPGGCLLGRLPCDILSLSEGSETLYWRFPQLCQFVPLGHLVFSHTITRRRPIRLNFCQVCRS